MTPKLRTLLFIGFTVIAVIPVLTLAWWVSSSALQKEKDAVKEKHLLVAQNLTNALSRYAIDTKQVFMLAEGHIRRGGDKPSPELSTLLQSLYIDRISLVNNNSISTYYSSPRLTAPITDQQLAKAKEIANTKEAKFLPVMTGSNNEPTLGLAHRLNDDSFVVAELSTTYFTQLQMAITFGKLGHAAIVDHLGNVLAHPKPAWVKSHKNISKISPVKRMINGEQDVSFFYSPAIKADMVAGFSPVPEAGWGAMVPQPVSELHERAARVEEVALIITASGITIALIFAWWFANFVADPTTKVAQAARRVAKDVTRSEPVPMPAPATQELTDLVHAFNGMADQVSSKAKELKHLADHDPLTGLPNRTLLKNHINRQIKQTKRDNTHFTLLFLDLDEFKEVNDSLGHGYGDMMLKEIGKRLLDEVGEHGLVARQGGDEFAIVLNPGEVLQLAENLSQRLTETISTPFYLEGEEIYIGASIGIAHCPKDANDMHNLLRCADLAMYAAKGDPGTTYQSYTAELHNTLSERKVLENELRQALINEEFELFYQPRVIPESGEIKGFEALVRWRHPTRDLVWPSDFIAITERTGEILRLGEWIIEQACIDHNRWQQSGHGNVRVSINLSERQFHVKNLVERIDAIFAKHQVDPKFIEFEITESLAMQKPTRVIEALNRLRQRGFQLSIDDFGTGYSSLERLKQLPIDKIKIDKSFVDGIGKNEKDSAIVEHIHHLAEGLSLQVVAEGIESANQLDFLRKIGCQEIQGFIYSPAVRWEETSDLLKQPALSPVQEVTADIA